MLLLISLFVGIVISSFCTSYMIISELNIKFDDSPIQVIEAKIIRYISTEKDGVRTYSKMVISETTHSPTFFLSLDESNFRNKPSRIRMKIRSGALGYQWLTDYKLWKAKAKEAGFRQYRRDRPLNNTRQ